MDRRKHKRYESDLIVNVTIEDKKRYPLRFVSRTKNVCSEGAYIVAEAPLDEGTPVQLELFFAIDRLLSIIGERQKVKVRVKGEVVRTGDGGMAVRFNRGYKITTLNSKEGKN